jgi:hypothetical protein
MVFYILLVLFSLLLLFCSRDCGSTYNKVFVLLTSFPIYRLKSFYPSTKYYLFCLLNCHPTCLWSRKCYQEPLIIYNTGVEIPWGGILSFSGQPISLAARILLKNTAQIWHGNSPIIGMIPHFTLSFTNDKNKSHFQILWKYSGYSQFTCNFQ